MEFITLSTMLMGCGVAKLPTQSSKHLGKVNVQLLFKVLIKIFLFLLEGHSCSVMIKKYFKKVSTELY